MNKEVFTKLQNKQIEVYKKLIGLLKESKPIINQFDGKMCNKKVSEALGGYNKETKLSMEIMDGCTLRVYSWDRDIIINGCNSVYIDCNDLEVNIILDTTKARPRIKAKETIDVIDLKIKTVLEDIKEIEKNLKEYDNMLRDGRELLEKIRIWKKKYNYTPRNSVYEFNALNKVY